MSKETTNTNYLQIRRPNKLYERPIKRSLALLYDILGFNFYVTNPKDTEFRMSWMDLEKIYGISTRNKDHIKKKLTELQEINYISDLDMWSNGFSYTFKDTFLSMEELLKPKTWTFLNFNIMLQLDSISYQLYTLAYKFYDFTDKSKRAMDYKNQTKFLTIEEFLSMFRSETKNIKYSKNRLLYLVRKAIENLGDNFGIDIDIWYKKFGRPTIAVKFLFRKVPKLKKIMSKFVDMTVQKVTRGLNKAKKIFQAEENWYQISADKRRRELLNYSTIAKHEAIKEFMVEGLFKEILESDDPNMNETKQLLKQRYIKKTKTFNMTTLKIVELFEHYRVTDTFRKFSRRGLMKNWRFNKITVEGKTDYWIESYHPVIPNLKGEVLVFQDFADEKNKELCKVEVK